MLCKGCYLALLTQHALDRALPDKVRVTKQKWNGAPFHDIEKDALFQASFSYNSIFLFINRYIWLLHLLQIPLFFFRCFTDRYCTYANILHCLSFLGQKNTRVSKKTREFFRHFTLLGHPLFYLQKKRTLHRIGGGFRSKIFFLPFVVLFLPCVSHGR